MDIRTQAYMQEMRRQQVYRAYVAGIGDDPTPPPPAQFTFTATYIGAMPSTGVNLSIDGLAADWNQSYTKLSGSTVTCYIECVDQQGTLIHTINGTVIDQPTC